LTPDSVNIREKSFKNAMKVSCKEPINPASLMIAGMKAQSVMHQDFLARIKEAEDLAARCANEKDRVGWLKIADNYRKQLSRLEPAAEEAEQAGAAPARSRRAA
jgi:hypothetical protein